MVREITVVRDSLRHRRTRSRSSSTAVTGYRGVSLADRFGIEYLTSSPFRGDSAEVGQAIADVDDRNLPAVASDGMVDF